MISRWQWNVLYAVAIGGAVVLFFKDAIGLRVSGLGLSAYSAILTFVLGQQVRDLISKRGRDKEQDNDDGDETP